MCLWLLRANWATAGHPTPIRFCQDTNSCTSLVGKDLALGVDGTWQYTTRETGWINPGESIVLISDGVTEASGEDGMFGTTGLEASIARHANGVTSAEDIVKGVVADVLRHAKEEKIDDDTSLVVVKG